MIHGPLVHCLRPPALSVKSIISARWKGRQYTERGMGGDPIPHRLSKKSCQTFSQPKNAVTFPLLRSVKVPAVRAARLARQGFAGHSIGFEAGFAPSSSPCAAQLFTPEGSSSTRCAPPAASMAAGGVLPVIRARFLFPENSNSALRRRWTGGTINKIPPVPPGGGPIFRQLFGIFCKNISDRFGSRHPAQQKLRGWRAIP